MGVASLASIVMPYLRENSLSITNPNSEANYPLLRLIRVIHYLPIETRKFLLDACRIQRPVHDNDRLRDKLHSLQGDVYIPICYHLGNTRESLHIDDITAIFDQIVDSPMSCSLLSYFCRAESTCCPALFLEERMKSIDKELKAAFSYHSQTQKLDYSALFCKGKELTAIHPDSGLSSPTTSFRFRAGIRTIRNSFSSRFSTILFPFYNGKKNLGYTTQEAFKRATWDGDVNYYGYTTLDLLRYYEQTGRKVQGPLEVRCSWKYNDLKPRVYYALGGTSYWAGLYIQSIANSFCKILPSTNPFSRFNVQRAGNLSSDHILVTYDYTSFTTSLSELKFFLFHLADAMSGTPVDILDVRHGVMQIDLGDLIRDYNNEVNIHQGIDLRRIFEGAEDNEFFQSHNGSLGVQGNIVFSTCLHGIALGGITDNPEEDSCVGDDALAKILKATLLLFITCVNNLGYINQDKFVTIEKPPQEDPQRQARESYKYLKRPVSVDVFGQIITGDLDFFPSFADALHPQGDGIHTSTVSRESEKLIRTFVMQWGRFLHLHCKTHHLSWTLENDLLVILSCVQAVYGKYGLPRSGAIPGVSVKVEYGEGKFSEYRWETLNAFVPPCDSLDVFETDWLEQVYTSFAGRTLNRPVRVGGEILIPFATRVGDRFTVTSNQPLLRLLEALGHVDVEPVVREVQFDDVLLRKLQSEFYDQPEGDVERMLVDVTVNSLPEWYFDVASRYYPDPSLVEPMKVEQTITSVFSGSVI